jgi:ATP-dependent Lon protease
VAKQREAHGIEPEQMTISKEVVAQIIEDYTRESGVRSLDKQIAKLARSRAKQIGFGEEYEPEFSAEQVREILGAPKFTRDKYSVEGLIGVVTGLAWTEVGGDILYIESLLTPGKGALSLTGNLGDVMKESATIAWEWVKAHHEELGIPAEKFEKYDINIHVPEGAVPKDGPSAGVTMTTALVSVFTGIPVRQDVAMTGEITLRGRVLPIGGLKEKTLAAYRAGITTLVIPKENVKDLEEIPPHVLSQFRIVAAETIDDVLKTALTHLPGKE